jgi:hypothetical protein
VKPSRELDVLVAEKVMGWTHVARSPMDGALLGTMPIYLASASNEVPHYSTDMAAAWAIVELGRGSFWNDLFELSANEGEEGTWHLDTNGDNDGCCMTAETAPLVICLAALRCVGK